MDFVRDKGRHGVALAEVIGYITDRLRPSPAPEPRGKVGWAKWLHDLGCWLVPLAADSKKPAPGTSFDVTSPRPGWPAIEEHLRRGGNYGVLAGKLQGGPHAGMFLGLQDWDEQEAHGRWLENIGRRPPRFVVRSASGGYHYYAVCDGPPPANSSYGHTHDGDEGWCARCGRMRPRARRAAATQRAAGTVTLRRSRLLKFAGDVLALKHRNIRPRRPARRRKRTQGGVAGCGGPGP
jgi:hypothetical protein